MTHRRGGVITRLTLKIGCGSLTGVAWLSSRGVNACSACLGLLSDRILRRYVAVEDTGTLVSQRSERA